jgi:hypothetical protein
VLIHRDAADVRVSHRVQRVVVGDSMLFVNKYGRRAVNELAQELFRRDPQAPEYPNLVMVALWGQRTQDPAHRPTARAVVPDLTEHGVAITVSMARLLHLHAFA